MRLSRALNHHVSKKFGLILGCEVVLFHKPEKRFVISPVNYVNIPINDIILKARTLGKPFRAALLPGETVLSFTHDREYANIEVPTLRRCRMLMLD